MRYSRIFLILLMLLACPIWASAEARAQETAELDLSEFSRLPILHDGRIKPLDSVALVVMGQLSGHENLHAKNHNQWLALILFDPSRAIEAPILKANIEALYAQANLPPPKDKQKYYSLAEISPLLQQTAPLAAELSSQNNNDLTQEQRDFLGIHQNAALFAKIMRSLSLILPLDATLPSHIASDTPPGSTLNFYTLSRFETPVLEQLQTLISAKGEDPENYSEEEKKLALFAFQMQTLRQAAVNNDWFKIIPGGWGTAGQNSGEWFAPWEIINNGQGSPAAAQYLGDWQSMALAYRGNDQSGWESAVETARERTSTQHLYSSVKFELEILYNDYKPYNWARWLYALSIIAMGLFMVRAYPLTRFAALASMGAAMAAHLFGITSRVVILDRPPVGTLYESVLFVALVCAFAGWIVAILRRQDMAALAAMISALGLLLLAPFIVPEGETLEVLVAVLNTNFWLATHVTIITAGYGMCVLAAVMAHFYMFARLKRPKGNPFVIGLYKNIYKVSIVALLLTSVGTVLGGIWADQSWGRFWGWDPKENGALLIVLWLIWIQHGRLSGKLRDLAFMAGMAYLNVIVALAWFGVNLLNVGLHSYGFTNGLAIGLGAFCGLETLLIASIWIGVRIQEKKGCKNVA